MCVRACVCACVCVCVMHVCVYVCVLAACVCISSCSFDKILSQFILLHVLSTLLSRMPQLLVHFI